jgi:hypothetical protein
MNTAASETPETLAATDATIFKVQLSNFKSNSMRLLFFILCLFGLTVSSCKKSAADKPKSKTDYIPINSAITPRNVALGQDIKSRVNLGFYSYKADVTFLGFELKEAASRQYEIRAKGFFDNINYEISLPVVMTFDTTLSIRPTASGQHIFRFYSSSQLVQTDTVQVN